jgi:hypothetical protein
MGSAFLSCHVSPASLGLPAPLCSLPREPGRPPESSPPAGGHVLRPAAAAPQARTSARCQAGAGGSLHTQRLLRSISAASDPPRRPTAGAAATAPPLPDATPVRVVRLAAAGTCATAAITAGSTKATRATTSPRGADGTRAPPLPSPCATSPPTNTAALPCYAGAMHFRLAPACFLLAVSHSLSPALCSLFFSL